jgi:hypothetical protein
VEPMKPVLTSAVAPKDVISQLPVLYSTYSLTNIVTLLSQPLNERTA